MSKVYPLSPDARGDQNREGPRDDDRAGEILDTIRRGPATTMSELAEALGMARSTVSLRVERFIECGLVTSQLDPASRRGRPAAILKFNAGAGVVLAAHLGMTGARVVATDLTGSILVSKYIEFSIASGPQVVLSCLSTAFEQALREISRTKTDVMGIGLGIPSPVELSTARSTSHHNADSWDEYPIEDAFLSEYGLRALVDHDLYLMSLAEQRLCWPTADVFLCVKVGTVIGCGVVINGRIVRGAQTLSGEIGHTRVSGDATPCWCGNVGCLDAVASGRALAAKLSGDGLKCESARDVSLMVSRGVPEAVQLVRAAGRDIGEVLAAAVNLLNPTVISFWGYLAEAEETLLAGLRESIYQRAVPGATRSLQLVKTRLGDEAGAIGSAMMVIEEIFSDSSIADTIEKSLKALS